MKYCYYLLFLLVLTLSCKKSDPCKLNERIQSNEESNLNGIEGWWTGKYGIADQEPEHTVGFNLKPGAEAEVSMDADGIDKGTWTLEGTQLKLVYKSRNNPEEEYIWEAEYDKENQKLINGTWSITPLGFLNAGTWYMNKK